MSIVSAIVLFAVIWFLVLFIVLPFRMETQGDIGKVVQGTHAGAPSSSFSMKRKAKITTIWAALVWLLIASVVIFGDIGIRDIDLFSRMGPGSGG